MSQKKILAPIDFSDCSIKALKIAIQIAKTIDAQLIIMNACQNRQTFGNISRVEYAKDFIAGSEADIRKAYSELEETLLELRNVEHDFIIKHAYAQDAIITMTLTNEIYLIVMGTTGASGFKGILFGSNTNTVIRNVKCPVLSIPEKASDNWRFRKIALAGDYQNTSSMSTFKVLMDLAEILDSEVHILHVSDTAVIDPNEAEEAKKLKRYFKKIPHSFHFKLDAHIDDGINKYVEENAIDLLAMVSKKHHLLDRIFKGSMTQRMAFHSKTPLLILHAK